MSCLSPLANKLIPLLEKKRLKFSGSAVERGRVLIVTVSRDTLSFNLAYLGPASDGGYVWSIRVLAGEITDNYNMNGNLVQTEYRICIKLSCGLSDGYIS